MKLNSLQSDEAILTEFGRRLARHRIDAQLTQAALAREAGVGKRTVERIENGHSAQMSSIVRLLRVLDLLPNLDRMLPEPGLSPLELVKLRGKVRQRVSSPRQDDRTVPDRHKP